MAIAFSSVALAPPELVPLIAIVPFFDEPANDPLAATSMVANGCIINDAKIPATTIFFFPVVFLANSDTTI